MSWLSEIFAGGASGVFQGIDTLVSRWKANPADVMKHDEAAAQIEASLAQAKLQFEAQLAQAQSQVNAIEAQSADKFNSRWRPFIGWVCGAGLAYAFIGQPLLVWASFNFKWLVPPVLDIDVLMTLLFGMLGIGSMRSFDKLKGTSK